MRDRQTLAVWILGLLVVAHHHQVCAGNDHFGSFVGLYTAANMPTVAAYHDISNYTATLPLPLLKNGVVYAGDNGRLRWAALYMHNAAFISFLRHRCNSLHVTRIQHCSQCSLAAAAIDSTALNCAGALYKSS